MSGAAACFFKGKMQFAIILVYYLWVHTSHMEYILVLGLYSELLDSKKLVDFNPSEYSLEITLKEKW